MADVMSFPKMLNEFMEQYKIVDTKQVYTNGSELVPIFRIRQWEDAHEPKNGKKFIEIVVEYPATCTYPEYEGKPYYSIRYEENGEKFEGFGTYKPEVLSKYICEYFIETENEVERVLDEPPTIDAVPVVRCKDCTYCSHFTDGHLECRLLYNLKPVPTTYCQMEENDFCSYGVRKDDSN